MKKLIYILIIFNLQSAICNLYAQWVQQVNPAINGLYDIQFINNNTGWITGTNSVILKTTNAGNNWIQQTAPIGGRELNNIQMFDANTGYIVGWTNTFLRTTNGGINWIQLPGPSASNGSLNDLSFINVNSGWICGFLGIVWKTTNGGISWDSLYTGNTGPLRNVQFLNSQTGWIAGDVGYIRKTTNGGQNWLFQFFGTTADYWFNALHFNNISTGWVVGRNDRIFRTTDGGNDWDTVSLITGGAVIKFINSFTGWCGGSLNISNSSVIYKTTNSGFNWLEQIIPTMLGFCGSISIYNDSTAWATFGNKIVHTSNGGTYVGINQLSNEIPENFQLHQNYPNPFNPNTTIKFEIPKEENVKLIIFDILGEEIQTIINSKLKTGIYNIFFNAEKLSSGIYFYTLLTNTMKITKKMILNK